MLQQGGQLEQVSQVSLLLSEELSWAWAERWFQAFDPLMEHPERLYI